MAAQAQPLPLHSIHLKVLRRIERVEAAPTVSIPAPIPRPLLVAKDWPKQWKPGDSPLPGEEGKSALMSDADVTKAIDSLDNAQRKQTLDFLKVTT